MKYNQGECYAKTYWYEATVTLFPDTFDEVEIECSIEINEDDNTCSEVINVNILNSEDIPKGYDETDIKDFVIENFE